MPPPDPLAASTHADPYPCYRELARTQPFHRDAMLMLWDAAGPAEVAAVLPHPACRVSAALARAYRYRPSLNARIPHFL